jgi:hypothetical protein
VGRLTDSHKKPADWENAYYVSSRPADSASPERWLQTLRDHWGGCEIRNHWRKDACLFEDKTRSRNPNLVANLMLIRNLVLHFYARSGGPYPSLPAFVEDLVAKPRLAFSLIHSSS